MTEDHANEVERALLHIDDARRRTAKAAGEVRDGSDEGQRAANALTAAELEIARVYKTLRQQAFYAISDETLKLSV